MKSATHALRLLPLLLAFQRARPRDGLLIALAFAVGAATLAILLSVPAGLERLAGRTGIERIVLVMGAAAASEADSELGPAQIGLVGSLPQVARAADGSPLLAPQFIASTRVADAAGTLSTVQLRGFSQALARLLAGSGVDHGDAVPAPGSQALVAGAEVAARLGLSVGSTLPLRGRDWHVMAQLDAGGSLWESELWIEQAALQAAFGAPGRHSVAWVRLAPDADFADFARALAADPRLDGLRAIEQTRYYRSQLGFVAGLARMAAWGVSLLLGAGAAIAIANALGVVLAARRSDMAALRAMGFRDAGVALANVLEVLLVGLLAAAACLSLAWWLLDGMGFATSAGAQGVHAALAVTPAVMASVLAYTLVLGLVGSAWPVMGLVRGHPIESLRGD